MKVQKTISIEYHQAKYVDEEKINLSSCVRDMLEEMITDKEKIQKLMDEKK